jgi:hypothetical protein
MLHFVFKLLLEKKKKGTCAGEMAKVRARLSRVVVVPYPRPHTLTLQQQRTRREFAAADLAIGSCGCKPYSPRWSCPSTSGEGNNGRVPSLSVQFGATVDPASRDGVRCARSCPLAARALMCLPAYAAYLFILANDGDISCCEIPATFEIPVGSKKRSPRRRTRNAAPRTPLLRGPGRAHYPTLSGGRRPQSVRRESRGYYYQRERADRERRRPGSPLQVHVVRLAAHSRCRRTRGCSLRPFLHNFLPPPRSWAFAVKSWLLLQAATARRTLAPFLTFVVGWNQIVHLSLVLIRNYSVVCTVATK